MIKIYLPERATQPVIGGGWSFTRNIQKALRGTVLFVSELKDADLYFIPGATLAQREEVVKAKEMGKKIVLRIDNILRNSRNRNTGTSRLYDFAQMADEVIYQSNWARNWVMPFVKKDGVVILNGADTEIFNENGPRMGAEGNPQYLYSRVRRDETKLWERAWHEFQKIYYVNPKAHLWIAGRFGKINEEYHFDFYGGAEKRYRYLGLIETPEEMAKIYRGADYLIYTYILDACSNVLIEAIMCGCKILYFGDGDNSALEILRTPKKELTIETMTKKYLEVFKRVCHIQETS